MGKDKQNVTTEHQNKENLLHLASGRPPLRQIGNSQQKQSVYNDRSIIIPKSRRGQVSPSKNSVKMYKSTELKNCATQTETTCTEKGCGTSDESSEAMISVLTGGPLNETYYESLAEQRREALSVTLEENEELFKEIEKLELSLSEMTKRAEDAEYKCLMFKLAEEEEVLNKSQESERLNKSQNASNDHNLNASPV